jgi:hypothetical protein
MLCVRVVFIRNVYARQTDKSECEVTAAADTDPLHAALCRCVYTAKRLRTWCYCWGYYLFERVRRSKSAKWGK